MEAALAAKSPVVLMLPSTTRIIAVSSSPLGGPAASVNSTRARARISWCYGPSSLDLRRVANISPFCGPSSVESTRAKAGASPLCVESSVESTRARAGASPLCVESSVESTRARAGASPFCGASSVESARARAGTSPFCGASSVASTRARVGTSPFCGASCVESTRARAGTSPFSGAFSVESTRARAGASPFCGPSAVESMRERPGILPFCGQSSAALTGAGAGISAIRGRSSVESRRAGILPVCGPSSAGSTRAGISAFHGPFYVELKSGEPHVSPICGTGFYYSAFLTSRGGLQRRSRRRSGYNQCLLRRRDHGILETEENGTLLSLAGTARLTCQLENPGRAVKWAVKQTLNVLLTAGSRLSWALLLFAGSCGGGENGNGLPKGDERNVWYQWFPTTKRKRLVFIISSVMIALLIVSGPTNHVLQPAWSLSQENLVFLEAWRTIDRAYVDKSFNGQSWFRYREDALRREPMKTRQETYDAIRKMLATLDDPFTRFLEPEKFKSLKSGTNGALTGVGLEVGFDVSSGGTSEDLVVVAPIMGGPAGRAGIVPGDVILAIDGVSTEGMGLYDAARRLQGPVNSQVELTLLNKATTMPKMVTVMREKVRLNPVSWKLCDISKRDQGPTKLGYIRLSTFNQNSTRDVKSAIENLRESGATSFVLDIRNNSGGLFPAGVEIAKMWLEKGVIVYITDSMGVRDIYDTDGEGAIATTEPLTVLVNRGTASAGEILAGALKDNNRAIIVGETTFGKGRIQSVFQLSDGSGMAVTVARYETPAHINIDKVGITPDHPLSMGVIPMEEESFCNSLQDPSSPFDGPSLFSR